MSGDADKPAAVIDSPCVRNCCLDEHDICLGCNRSLTEICAWSGSTDAEKLDILTRSRVRAEERLGKPGAGPGKPW